MRWDNAFLDRLVASSLLRYLAIAHYGRGRGDWKQSEYPAFWRTEVDSVLLEKREAFAATWSLRGPPCDRAQVASRLRALLAEAARAVLAKLYGDAVRDDR